MIRKLSLLLLLLGIAACSGTSDTPTAAPTQDDPVIEETVMPQSQPEAESTEASLPEEPEGHGEMTPTPLPDVDMMFTINDEELRWEVTAENGAAIYACPAEDCDTLGFIATGVQVLPVGFNEDWLDLQPGEGRGGYLRVADTQAPS